MRKRRDFMEFKIRLKELREELPLSQLQMGKELNISNVTLSQYEKGIRKPDIETLQILAEYFDVTTDYLLGKSDIRKYDNSSTIAAHKDNDTWTEEELEEITRFKEFVKMKRMH